MDDERSPLGNQGGGFDPEDPDDATGEFERPVRRYRRSAVLLVLGAVTWAAVGIIRHLGPGDPRSQPALSVETVAVERDGTPPSGSEPDSPAGVDRSSAQDLAESPERTRHHWVGTRAEWAASLDVPTTITYTVRRGGTLENVANLFKVFHHEIVALNPGLDLEGQLRPGTAVTVYRKPRDPSESIGLPSAGSLENGIPLPEGPGRTILALPYKTWGTARTVALLDGVLRQWAERKRGVQPILVGNLSSRHGGRLAPHSTHQSGRDVDLGYVQRLQRGEEHNWREMTADNLDAQQTWALIDLLLQTGAVEVIYIDRALQKLLYDHAKERGLMSSGQLAELMEYPKAVGQGSPLIQHVPGHTDHLHVRFECGPAEARCRSKS